MDSPGPLPVSPASSSAHLPGQEELAAEEPGETVGTGSRMTARRRMGQERLLRYVHDVIRRQRTPLHEILRDHALPFLPAWSLLRLRAVSASWNRHISSPFFAHTQSISHRSPSGLLPTSVPYPPSRYLPFHPDSGAVPDPSFGFLPESAVRVRASARGLVCCSDLGHPRRRPRYYVCNPATAQWTAVPGSSVYNHHAVALLFEPSPLDFSADFDLVCVVQSNRRTGFEVFSSSTGKWSVRSLPRFPLKTRQERACQIAPSSSSRLELEWTDKSRDGCREVSGRTGRTKKKKMQEKSLDRLREIGAHPKIIPIMEIWLY